VDDRVHAANVIDLLGEQPGLGRAGEVADDDSRGALGKAGDRRRPRSAAGVQDDLMALINEDTGGSAAEPVGGAGIRTRDTK